jgi:predicted RNA-binding Zn-ribbon protein involved in translation (DUF1610 family)
MKVNSTWENNPALIFDYFDDGWRTDVYTCPMCGWEGSHWEMSGPNLFRELMDFECPECEKMLLIVNYATYKEAREAAAKGNQEAVYALGVMSGEGPHWEDYKLKIEAYNQGLREAWLNFDGPKRYFVKTPDGYVEADLQYAEES